MKDILFATVNGQRILGKAILDNRKKVFSDQQDELSFAQIPNESNNSFLNAEALQNLIDLYAVAALAKFEGISVSDEEISHRIYELRSSYEDVIEWEINLNELGIDDKNMREMFYLDIMADKLINSHLENFDGADSGSSEEFYYQNVDSMKTPNTYTFIEISTPNTDRLKLAATILSQNNTASIVKEAEKYDLEIVVNEDIPHHKLPESLQEMLKDLEENKIATIPMEDDTLVLIKLLRKINGKNLSLEEALPSITEYLKYQQHKNILDNLTALAVEKCDIIYHNTEQLKHLI